MATDCALWDIAERSDLIIPDDDELMEVTPKNIRLRKRAEK